MGRMFRYAGAALALALAGCGYTTRLKLPEGQQRIGVELFANQTVLPDLERQLHSSVTRAVREYTGSELVQPGRAQSIVRGIVLNYRRRGGIRTAQNVWQEAGVIIDAEASLVDASSGELLARARANTQVGFTFGVAGGETAAREYALDNLAERLVLELFVVAIRKEEGRRDPELGSGPDGAVPRPPRTEAVPGS